MLNTIDILPREIWFHILDYIDDYDTYNNLQFVCQLFMKYCQINDRFTIIENGSNIKIYNKNQCIFEISINDVLICYGGPCINGKVYIRSVPMIMFKMYIFERDFYQNFLLEIESIESYKKYFYSLDKMLKHLQLSIEPFQINRVFKIFTNKIICINNIFNMSEKKYISECNKINN